MCVIFYRAPLAEVYVYFCLCVCVVWWGLGTNVKSSPPLPSYYLYCLRQACCFGRHWKVFPVEKPCVILHFSNPDFAPLPLLALRFLSEFKPCIFSVHILEVKTYFRHWKRNQIPLSTAMAAPPCRPNWVYIRKMGWEHCKLEKCSTATVRDDVWGCETLQNPTHPPHWLVNSFLPGWALPAIDSTPPPLLCSVIQTWKVNNKLTSSLVCILLWCSQTSNLLKADHLCLRNRYGFKKLAETGKAWSFCFIELCVDLLPDLHILHVVSFWLVQ